jgi:hypothetical protein
LFLLPRLHGDHGAPSLPFGSLFFPFRLPSPSILAKKVPEVSSSHGPFATPKRAGIPLAFAGRRFGAKQDNGGGQERQKAKNGAAWNPKGSQATQKRDHAGRQRPMEKAQSAKMEPKGPNRKGKPFLCNKREKGKPFFFPKKGFPFPPRLPLPPKLCVFAGGNEGFCTWDGFGRLRYLPWCHVVSFCLLSPSLGASLAPVSPQGGGK